MCCKALAITQLNKATGVACPKLLPGRCGVQADRPGNPEYEDCNTYYCLWLLGSMNETDRPDKIKTVFTVVPHPNKDIARQIIVVNEGFPGAADSKRPKELIKGFLRSGYQVVVKNPQYSTEYQPNGSVVRYTIDRSDPLLMKYDPAIRPVVLTVGGKTF